MDTGWYMLRVVPKKDPDALPPMEPVKREQTPDSIQQETARDRIRKERENRLNLPSVGEDFRHFAMTEDNDLYKYFEDGVRPAWAPDFKRLGYAIVFKREALPDLAVNLGIKRVENAGRNDLTFNDVWAIAVVPERRPLRMPPLTHEEPSEWWAMVQQPAAPTDPRIVPGGVTVATGGQRLGDVVTQMLMTPNGYPRMRPDEKEPVKTTIDYNKFGEFMNGPPPIRNSYERLEGQGRRNRSGWAGIEIFKYGGWGW